MAGVEQHTAELEEGPVRWLSAPSESNPIVYVHGVPDSAEVWTELLERTGGVAVDLPGFGRSAKRANFDYTITGYGSFLERFLDRLEVDRFSLVVHDWGVVALELAQRSPERIERLVVINGVPLLPGYRWHRMARAWRTPLVGEVVMGAITPRLLRRAAQPTGRRGPLLPASQIATIERDFDQGTQRAILALYRSASPRALAEAGRALNRITAPALVVWGERDPYISADFADAYAQALSGETEVLRVAGGGHWPWLGEREVLDAVVAFLGAAS